MSDPQWVWLLVDVWGIASIIVLVGWSRGPW